MPYVCEDIMDGTIGSIILYLNCFLMRNLLYSSVSQSVLQVPPVVLEAVSGGVSWNPLAPAAWQQDHKHDKVVGGSKALEKAFLSSLNLLLLFVALHLASQLKSNWQ